MLYFGFALILVILEVEFKKKIFGSAVNGIFEFKTQKDPRFFLYVFRMWSL